jgi:hypothetical protein
MVGFQIIVFAMVLLLRKARKNERGQKPEEIYVIEDKQLQNLGPSGKPEVRQFVDRQYTGEVM